MSLNGSKFFILNLSALENCQMQATPFLTWLLAASSLVPLPPLLPVFICCTEHQHVLSSCRIRFWWQVFLSKTPVMWVLYFLNQSSDFLLFSISLSFALLGDDFFNFQPVCWVFISVIVLNFLFSSVPSRKWQFYITLLITRLFYLNLF